MLLDPKEIKEKADKVEIDHHFEIRLKGRNIKLEEIRYHLKNTNPAIKEMNGNKYKLSYQLEKDRYLTMYILNTQKGLKLLTVFIEKKVK